MIYKLIITTFTSLILLTVGLLSPTIASAQSISVTPTVIDIAAANNWADEIVITNATNQPVTLSTRIVLIERLPTSIRKQPVESPDFITGIPETFEVAPGANFRVEFEFSRADAPQLAGFTEVGIVFSEQADSGNLASNTSVGTDIVVSLLTNDTTQITLDQIGLRDITAPSLLNFLPEIVIDFEVFNNSISYIRPKGVISVSPVYGFGQPSNFNLNPEQKRILPGQSVSQEYELTGIQSWGYLTVEGNYTIDDSTQIQGFQFNIIYIPLSLVIGFIISLVILISIFVYIIYRDLK